MSGFVHTTSAAQFRLHHLHADKIMETCTLVIPLIYCNTAEFTSIIFHSCFLSYPEAYTLSNVQMQNSSNCLEFVTYSKSCLQLPRLQIECGHEWKTCSLRWEGGVVIKQTLEDSTAALEIQQRDPTVVHPTRVPSATVHAKLAEYTLSFLSELYSSLQFSLCVCSLFIKVLPKDIVSFGGL